MAPAVSWTVCLLPIGSGPGSATRRIVATGAAASATRRPSMESCQSPARKARLTLTTSSGLGETWGGGADRMDAPSSSMASTVTTGTGFSSVAARPPSSNMPVVTAPAPRKTGSRMPDASIGARHQNRKRSLWQQLRLSR